MSMNQTRAGDTTGTLGVRPLVITRERLTGPQTGPRRPQTASLRRNGADFESVRGGSTPPGATPRDSPARCAGHDDFPAFALRYPGTVTATGKARRPRRMRGSVQWCSAAAAWTHPFSDGFRVRAFAARMGLLARPPCAQAHRAVPAWALLRFHCLFCFLLGHRATLSCRAGVAELVDAPGLGPGGACSLEVQVLSPALPTEVRSAAPTMMTSVGSHRRHEQVQRTPAKPAFARIRFGIQRRPGVASCPRALLLRRPPGGPRLLAPLCAAPRQMLPRARGRGPSAVRSTRCSSSRR
jgi:hypothetical protein